MSLNKVGNRIKTARKAKNLTQKELAKLLGCSHTTISKYEQGEIENMPRPRIQKLADILGVSPIILFNFEEEKQEEPADIDRLSIRKKEFIKRVALMSDAELDRLEQILALVETNGQ